MGLFKKGGFFDRNIKSIKKDVSSAGKFVGRNVVSAGKDAVKVGAVASNLTNKIVTIPGVGEAIFAATGIPVEQLSNLQKGLFNKINNKVNGSPIGLGAPQLADAGQHTVYNKTLPYSSPAKKIGANVLSALSSFTASGMPLEMGLDVQANPMKVAKGAPQLKTVNAINPTLKGGNLKDRFLIWYYDNKSIAIGIGSALIAIPSIIWAVYKFKKSKSKRR